MPQSQHKPRRLASTGPRGRMVVRPVLCGGLLGAALISVTGCNRSLEHLDREVAGMIEQRQRLSLGQQGVHDASAGRPDTPAASSNLYKTQPPTTNPPPDELPARVADKPATPDQQSYEPEADQEPVELDLPALLAYAIEHAPEYRSQKEALFLETLSLVIERHEWGPRFFNTLSSGVAGTPESGDFDTALDIVNDFRVTQRLPYGGTASINALVNYTNLLQRASTNPTARDTQDASLNASINLPLLRGAGMVARESLIQAERDLVYAARDFERFRRTFFVDIANTYFGLLRQQSSIENQRRQIEGLERLATEQRRLFETGRIPEFEATDAEAQVLFGQSDLASALDNYASSLDTLKLRIGMPVATPLDILPGQIDVPTPALDPAESIVIGQSARLDLQTSADRVEDARRGVRIARDQLRGDLDLDASIDLNSDSGSDVDGVDLELSDSDYSVALEYSVPLDRKIELAQYRSSLVDLERTIRDYRVQRDRVSLDIRDASREIARATLTLKLQVRNVQLAERRLENVKIQRQRGQVPPRRVIEAEQDLLDARNSRDQARTDLQTSVLNYLLQTGQMRVDAQGQWLAPGSLRPADAPEQPPQPGDADAGQADPEEIGEADE